MVQDAEKQAVHGSSGSLQAVQVQNAGGGPGGMHGWCTGSYEAVVQMA